MQIPIKTTLPYAALLQHATTATAANCGGYADRENFCSTLAGQSSWRRTCENGRNSKKCHFECQGSGMPQQRCWDANENIINQCFKNQNGGGYHYGTWQLNGHSFSINRCSA